MTRALIVVQVVLLWLVFHTQSPSSPAGSAVTLGIELKGLHVDIGEDPSTRHPGAFGRGVPVLHIHHGVSHQILLSLKDFVGLVAIRSGADALKFVRLRTGYSTYNLWHGQRREVEILKQSDVDSIPLFGVRPQMPPPRNQISGYLGVLSIRAYTVGRFTPVIVTKVADGYQITRWLYVDDFVRGNRVETNDLVQEFVSSDGRYKRKVLRTMSAQQLPNTVWQLDRLE